MNNKMISYLYGTTAAILLLCLFDLPYGAFNLIRFLSTIAFCFFAYYANLQGKKELTITFVILAILFQPLLKIHLGRVIWNVFDVIVAIFLIVLLFVNNKKSPN